MDISIRTSDPENVDPEEIVAVLHLGGYFVLSVDVNDGEKGWVAEGSTPPGSLKRPAVPDLSMTVAGEYTGNAYPAPDEYRLTMSVLDTGEDYAMVIEDTSGGVINSLIIDSATADGVIRMASTDHTLSGYEDDWTIPEGMERTLTWSVGADDYVIRLHEGDIDQIAAWLRYATGEENWDWAEQGEEWQF